jgi:hypothetical protein
MKDIVDFLMQRPLEDIQVCQSSDTSERLITLACGHIFTVETLDGHCAMGDYYEIDEMGKFLSTKEPPTDYQLPPTCPSCRGPITALRYGRVTKRATLDILEQNVASTMSKSLERLNPEMASVSDSVAKLSDAAKKMMHDMENTSDPSAVHSTETAGKVTEALPVTRLDRGAMHSVHGLSTDEAKAWHEIVGDLIKVYKKVHALSKIRGAHVQAYEGAFTTLYRQELQEIANDPTRATDTPEPVAMAAAKRMIGQPPPKADVRFQIEAHFQLLELRYMLAQVACSRIEGLPITATHSAGVKHRSLWTSFVQFVYESCAADARKALHLAQDASATRLAARCGIHVLRAMFELYRFQVMTERYEMTKPGATNPLSVRDQLADKVKAYGREVEASKETLKQTYVRSRPIKSVADIVTERTWFNENCGTKLDRIVKELEDLEAAIRSDGTYQPLTLQEREEIVKAFDFGQSHHIFSWCAPLTSSATYHRLYWTFL